METTLARDRSAQMTVFVIDDEPGIVQLCQRLLQRAGFQVHTFLDPRQGIHALEFLPAELLLLDIRMPELDGFQVLEQARNKHPEIAVVVMTGFGTVETAIEALRRGADGLILKPFSGAELVDSVQRALELNRHKQDISRLQALRPLFAVTETLFTETDPLRLQSLILEAVLGQLRCNRVEVFQPSAVEPATLTSLHSDAAEGSTMLADLTAGGQHLPLDGEHQTWPLLIYRKADLAPEWSALLDQNDLECVLMAPLDFRLTASDAGQLPDILVAARSKGRPLFGESELEMFMILVSQANGALENARLHAALKENIQQLEESQRALIQAEKIAIAGRLTASIAHEINNPLQAVRNCLHLAGRKELTPADRQNYLDLAQAELERLTHTVQRMLDFYRPVSSDRKLVDLNALWERIAELLHKQLEDHRVNLHLDLDPQLPMILAVGDQIQQVFLNLTLNGIEAMPAGGDLIILTQKKETKSRLREIEVLVKDSGPGVPEGERKHIFEPFISTKEKGTGLGLAVSFGIVTAHGGSLELVDSQPPGQARGACFRITFPIAEHT
jgi:signal transduction histidine kinase/FixJ family two-component response regulator